MQEDALSPTLFTLFIADLKKFLWSNGVRGVSLDHKIEIILLAFAVDIVMCADSVNEMKKIIKHLREYCKINKLEVSIETTKVVIFRKRGHAGSIKKSNFQIWRIGNRGGKKLHVPWDFF